MLDGQHGSWGQDSLIQGATAVSPARRCRSRASHTTFFRSSANCSTRASWHHRADGKHGGGSASGGQGLPLPTGGERSYGWGRALTYGDDYAEWINDQLFVAVQLETVQAVENAQAILAVRD